MTYSGRYAEVLAAAREYMTGHHAHHIESHDAVHALAVKLGVPTRGGQAGDRFAAQVRRAMNALTAEGVLVKIPRNGYHPGGSQEPNTAWYTPGAYAAAVKRAQRRDQERLAAQARWESVIDRLAGLGFMGAASQGDSVTLDLADWEDLLQLLELGKDIRA